MQRQAKNVFMTPQTADGIVCNNTKMLVKLEVLQESNRFNLLQIYHFQNIRHYLSRVKRIWFLSPMRAANVQASLRIRAASPEPPLLAHTSSESRGTFSQKARSLAPLNGWTCAVKICYDGMLEDTNSLDAAHLIFLCF